MTDNWKPDIFEIATPSGPQRKNGYTYRSLGLFLWRTASPKGKQPATWSLIHLGTGHRLANLNGDAATVFPVATEIAEAGEWDFLSLKGWPDRFPDAPDRLGAIIARYPEIASPADGGNSCAPTAQQIAANQP